MKKEEFKLGKTYKHSGGRTIKIVGIADTTTYGICLIAEEPDGKLYPVGKGEDHFLNWKEITPPKHKTI